MKRNPVPLLVYVLAIGQGTLLFPVIAGAIPDNQAPVNRHNRFDSRLSHQQPDSYYRGRIQAPMKIRRDRQSLSFASHICWQDPGSIAPTEYRSKGKSCVDPSDTQQRFSVQLGRRIGTSDDILGEFDGVRVDYRLSDRLKLNGIAGYPVLAAKDMFNSNRQVFGISVATNQLGRTWDLNGYLIEQRVNGQTNGKSMGGVIRRLQSRRSLLAYLDYDVTDNSLVAHGVRRLETPIQNHDECDHRPPQPPDIRTSAEVPATIHDSDERMELDTARRPAGALH